MLHPLRCDYKNLVTSYQVRRSVPDELGVKLRFPVVKNKYRIAVQRTGESDGHRHFCNRFEGDCGQRSWRKREIPFCKNCDYMRSFVAPDFWKVNSQDFM